MPLCEFLQEENLKKEETDELHGLDEQEHNAIVIKIFKHNKNDIRTIKGIIQSQKLQHNLQLWQYHTI